MCILVISVCCYTEQKTVSENVSECVLIFNACLLEAYCVGISLGILFFVFRYRIAARIRTLIDFTFKRVAGCHLSCLDLRTSSVEKYRNSRCGLIASEKTRCNGFFTAAETSCLASVFIYPLSIIAVLNIYGIFIHTVSFLYVACIDELVEVCMIAALVLSVEHDDQFVVRCYIRLFIEPQLQIVGDMFLLRLDHSGLALCGVLGDDVRLYHLICCYGRIIVECVTCYFLIRLHCVINTDLIFQRTCGGSV